MEEISLSSSAGSERAVRDILILRGRSFDGKNRDVCYVNVFAIQELILSNHQIIERIPFISQGNVLFRDKVGGVLNIIYN